MRRYIEQPLPVCPSGGVAFVDARDAAIGMVLALENGRAGERYVLSACNCTTFGFLSRIARVAGIAEPRIELPNNRKLKTATSWLVGRAEKLLGRDDSLPDRTSIDISQLYWYVDASRAEQVLHWRPRDPMVTLADTVTDLRERGIVPYVEAPSHSERVERN